jgi:thiamine-monophosphate kinase
VRRGRSRQGLGEFERIRRFFAPLAGPGGLGLMDDAALIDCTAGHRLVLTVDQAVENVHYLPSDPADLVAKKLLRRNLSDLAAMGAVPEHYLLTTALPADRGDDWLERFAAGLADDQKRYRVDLLGGDSTATAGPAVMTLTAIGEVADGRDIRRSGARRGDRIWVSGTIGDAFLGLRVLRGDHVGLGNADSAALVARFQLPEPRTSLGPRLSGIASAMIDVSDGLVGDLGHICEASEVGATVTLDAVPMSPPARKLVAAEPALAIRLATAGDDYELLFTAPPAADAAIGRLIAELGLPITAIGTIDEGSGVRLADADGKAIAIEKAGWQHF